MNTSILSSTVANRMGRYSAVLISCIFATSSVNAAEFAKIDGLTQLQSETGDKVQTVCGQLSTLENLSPDDPASDLKTQCGAMVRAANQIQESGNTSNSAKLGAALQNVATEEMGTPSRISTNTLSGQVAAINSRLLGLHKLNLGGGSGDDAGSLLSNRLSTFVNGVGGFGDIKASTQEDAANFNNAGVILGADYRITDHFLLGMAGGYTGMNADFIKNINVAGGSIAADIFNISLFSSYDIKDFYVDGSFSYGWSDYDVIRHVVIDPSISQGVDRVATSNPNGDQYSTVLGLGYNFHQAALNVSPFVRFNYFHGQIDRYSEQGAQGLNLTVDKQNFESLQSNVGGQVSYAFSQSFGVITPQISFSYNHEFLNNSRNINAQYSADPYGNKLSAVTNSPDRDFFILGAGVSSVLRGGVQLFFNYQALLGYDRVTSHGFTGGVRLEF